MSLEGEAEVGDVTLPGQIFLRRFVGLKMIRDVKLSTEKVLKALHRYLPPLFVLLREYGKRTVEESV